MSEAAARTDDREARRDQDDQDHGRPAARRGGRTAAALGVVLVVGALLAALIVFVAADAGEDDEVEEVRLVIPSGTSAALAEGEDVDVVEALLRLEAGAVLVVENADERPHVVGPLTAAPGEVVRRAFDAEGRYPGDTSVRADGRLTILVEAAAEE